MYQHLVEPPGHIAHAPWHQSLVCCVVYNSSSTSQHFTLDTTSTRLLYFTLVTLSERCRWLTPLQVHLTQQQCRSAWLAACYLSTTSDELTASPACSRRAGGAPPLGRCRRLPAASHASTVWVCRRRPLVRRPRSSPTAAPPACSPRWLRPRPSRSSCGSGPRQRTSRTLAAGCRSSRWAEPAWQSAAWRRRTATRSGTRCSWRSAAPSSRSSSSSSFTPTRAAPPRPAASPLRRTPTPVSDAPP